MTTRAELEAIVPEPMDRVAEAVGRLVHTARAATRARRALNGEMVGRELDNRIAACHAATMEHHRAMDDLLAAEAAAEANEGADQ